MVCQSLQGTVVMVYKRKFWYAVRLITVCKETYNSGKIRIFKPVTLSQFYLEN